MISIPFFVCIIFLLSFLSCQKSEFDYAVYMPVQEFDYRDTLQYQYVSKENGEKEVFLSVRYTNDYEFNNLWLKIEEHGQEERVDIPLFDKTGKPFGKSSGGLITQTVQWKNATLSEGDSLSFRITQNMRVNPLKFITEVGVLVRPTP